MCSTKQASFDLDGSYFTRFTSLTSESTWLGMSSKVRLFGPPSKGSHSTSTAPVRGCGHACFQKKMFRLCMKGGFSIHHLPFLFSCRSGWHRHPCPCHLLWGAGTWRFPKATCHRIPKFASISVCSLCQLLTSLWGQLTTPW